MQLHYCRKTKEIRLDSRECGRMLKAATEPAMPTEPKKPLIFISYAHADEPEHPAEGEVKWLSFVTGYLRPAIKHLAVDLWTDWRIPGGADWEREVEQKLRACDVFLVLVSTHSLSSDYIVDKEIPIIRERQAKGEAVHFYPLVLTPTPKIALDLVRDKNLRPRDGKPFSAYPSSEREQQMSEAADEIAEIATTIRRGHHLAAPNRSAKASEQAAKVAPFRQDPEIHDEESLESWLKGQSLEVALIVAARATLRISPLVSWPTALPSAIFGATAVARLAGKYPTRAKALRAVASAAYHAARRDQHARPAGVDHDAARDAFAAAALSASAVAKRPSMTASIAALAVGSAAKATCAVGAAGWHKAFEDALASPQAPDNAAAAEAYGKRAADAYGAAVGFSERSNFWYEIRADIAAVQEADSDWLADLPLWSATAPDWARNFPGTLASGLPKGEDWNVWIDWYEQRLRGGSRGEAYEFTFASVPIDVWDKGPAAVNSWIRARLPRE
jgi:hypothetical protein